MACCYFCVRCFICMLPFCNWGQNHCLFCSQCQCEGNNSFHSLFWNVQKKIIDIICWILSIWGEKNYSENASSSRMPNSINNTTTFKNHCGVKEKLRYFIIIDWYPRPPHIIGSWGRTHMGLHGFYLFWEPKKEKKNKIQNLEMLETLKIPGGNFYSYHQFHCNNG